MITRKTTKRRKRWRTNRPKRRRRKKSNRSSRAKARTRTEFQSCYLLLNLINPTTTTTTTRKVQNLRLAKRRESTELNNRRQNPTKKKYKLLLGNALRQRNKLLRRNEGSSKIQMRRWKNRLQRVRARRKMVNKLNLKLTRRNSKINYLQLHNLLPSFPLLRLLQLVLVKRLLPKRNNLRINLLPLQQLSPLPLSLQSLDKQLSTTLPSLPLERKNLKGNHALSFISWF
jgi:hypothetical protein